MWCFSVVDAPDEEIDQHTAPLYQTGVHAWGNHPFTSEEREQLEDALHRISGEIRHRGILLKPMLQDFDRNRWGFIPRRIFRRQLLAALRGLSEHEAKLIERRYLSEEETDVNYRAFCVDIDKRERGDEIKVDKQQSSRRKESPSKSSMDKCPNKPHTVEDVKQLVLADFIRRHVNVRDFFLDYDPLNTGTCEHSQFQRGLKSSGLELGETPHVTLQLLADEYFDPACARVRYSDFCDWLESVFYTQGLEKIPTVPFDDVSKQKISATLRQHSGRSIEPDTVTTQALSWIRRKVRTERIELVPYFQCFDAQQENCITAERFKRVLAQLGILPSSDEEIQALLSTYRDRTKAGNQINWRRFTMDVDNASSGNDSEKILGVSGTRTLPKHTKGQTEMNPEEIIMKVKRHVRQKQLRIKDFIRDFDRVNEGLVSRQNLCSAFSQTDLSLKAEEIAALCHPFETDSGRDGEGNPLIRWHVLVNYIDPITEEEPEADCISSIRTLSVGLNQKLRSTLQKENQYRLNEEERDEVATLMRGLSFQIKSQGTITRPFFRDFDSHRHGTVEPSRFFRACAMLKLSLSENDQRLLRKAFYTPGRGGEEISYEWFVAACESDPIEFCNELAQVPPNSPLTLDKCARIAEKISSASSSSSTRNPPRRRNSSRTAATVGNKSADMILGELTSRCKEKGILLKEMCRDFDPLRLGKMTKSKFRSALSMARIDLSDEEFNTLTDAYTVYGCPEEVYWHDIVCIVDEHDEELEKAPLSKRKESKSPSRVSTMKTEGSSDSELQEILKYVRHNVQSKRINFKPRFRDFDPLRRNTIHRSKFMMVLDTEPGLRLEAKDLQKLADAFACSKTDVSYSPFLKEIDPDLDQA